MSSLGTPSPTHQDYSHRSVLPEQQPQKEEDDKALGGRGSWVSLWSGHTPDFSLGACTYTCTAQIIQRLGSFPSSHLCPITNRARAPVTLSCDIFWNGPHPEHKVSIKQGAAGQQVSWSWTCRPQPSGPSVAALPIQSPALPWAGFTQKPVTHSLTGGSSEQLTVPE